MSARLPAVCELALHVERVPQQNTPVYAREALDNLKAAPGGFERSCGVVGVRGGCLPDGRSQSYVVLCGRRALHLWRLGADQSLDGTDADAANSCYSLVLPSTGLCHSQHLVAVFHTVGSEEPCALVVSPEGVAKLWPCVARPEHFVQRGVDLKGQVAAQLCPLECGTRFLLSTTSGELYLLQIAIAGRSVPELSCAAASASGGVLYSVGKRVSSLLFGSGSGSPRTPAALDEEALSDRVVNVVLLPAARFGVQSVAVVMSRCVQIWRVDEQQGGGSISLINTVDLSQVLVEEMLSCIGGNDCPTAEQKSSLESWIVDCCAWKNGLVLLAAASDKHSRRGHRTSYAFAYLSLDGPMDAFDCISAAEFEQNSMGSVNWQQSRLYSAGGEGMVVGGGDLLVFCICVDAVAAVRIMDPAKMGAGARVPFACTSAVRRFTPADVPLGAAHHAGSMYVFLNDSELCTIQLVPKDLTTGDREASSVTRSVERRSRAAGSKKHIAAMDPTARRVLAAAGDCAADNKLYDTFQTAYIRYSNKKVNAACDLVESVRRSICESSGSGKSGDVLAALLLRVSATVLDDQPASGDEPRRRADDRAAAVPFMVVWECSQLVGKRECLRRLHSFAQHTGLLLQMGDQRDKFAALNEHFEKVATALAVHKSIADRVPKAVQLAVSDVLAERQPTNRHIFPDLYIFFWQVSDISALLPRVVSQQWALLRRADDAAEGADSVAAAHHGGDDDSDTLRPCEDVAFCSSLIHACAQAVLAARGKPLWAEPDTGSGGSSGGTWTLGAHWVQSMRDMLRVCKAAASLGAATPAARTSLGEHAALLCLDALQLQRPDKRPALAADLCQYLEKAGWVNASWKVACDAENFAHLTHLCVDLEPDFMSKRRALSLCADRFHAGRFADAACTWLIANGRPSELMQLALHEETDQLEHGTGAEILREAAVRTVLADERLSWIFCAKRGVYDKARDSLTTIALSDGEKAYRTVQTLLSLAKLSALATGAGDVNGIDEHLVLFEAIELCPDAALRAAGYLDRDTVPMLSETDILEIYAQTPGDVSMDERSAVAALRLLERLAQRAATAHDRTHATQLLDDFTRLHGSLWTRLAADDNWAGVMSQRDPLAAAQRTRYFGRCVAYCQPSATSIDPFLTGASRASVIPHPNKIAAELSADVPHKNLVQLLQFGVDVMQSQMDPGNEDSTVFG